MEPGELFIIGLARRNNLWANFMRLGDVTVIVLASDAILALVSASVMALVLSWLMALDSFTVMPLGNFEVAAGG